MLLDTFVGVVLSACLIVSGSLLWLLKIPPPPRPRPSLKEAGSAHVAMNVCRVGTGINMRCCSRCLGKKFNISIRCDTCSYWSTDDMKNT